MVFCKFSLRDGQVLDLDQCKPEGVALLWRAVGLCHTVTCGGEGKMQELHAESPDELALVSGVARFFPEHGFFGEDVSSGRRVLLLEGGKQRFELLHVLEFTSERKV